MAPGLTITAGCHAGWVPRLTRSVGRANLRVVPIRKQLKRYETPGHVRFLTCSCVKRLPLLGNDRIKALLAHQLGRARELCRFELYGWVIMPEHFHLLLRPNHSVASVPNVLNAIKSPVAKKVIARWRALNAPILNRIQQAGRVRFWLAGGGYDRNIVTEAEYFEKLSYIHSNPVQRGLASMETDWEWSSARWYAGERSGPVQIDRLK